MITAKESGNWYDKDGNPVYKQIVQSGPNKGNETDTTLRHARKLNLAVGTTKILNVPSKPQLEIWKQNQLLLAALTMERKLNESEDNYIKRIVEDSKEQGKEAALQGTLIHTSVEEYMMSGEHLAIEGHKEICEAVQKAIYEKYGKTWIHEKSFTNRKYGYGGKVDLHNEMCVGDIKSKEFNKVDGKVVNFKGKGINLAYDENGMQLAAYKRGLGLAVGATTFNIYVSRNIPGIIHIHEWTLEEDVRHWEMFKLLLAYWKLDSNYEYVD